MEKDIEKTVIGQPAAVAAISKALRSLVMVLLSRTFISCRASVRRSSA